MSRPLTATIHLPALRHNLALARRHAGNARVWAVVKANAYGHGLERAVRAFAEADGFALIEIDAALRLRELGWNKPILLLEGFFEASDLPLLAAHDIQTAVHCERQLAQLEEARLETPLHVHLKLNGGMNRLGFRPSEFRAAHARLARLPSVRAVTFMMHFANADAPLNEYVPVDEQMRRFNAACDGLPGERCVANSAAVLTRPDLAFDWVRPGIMLYGATPGGASAADYGLKAAMTLESEIIGVQHIQPGEAVGYGSRFVAEVPMTIGVVACGYADGYPRHAPSGTPVLVDGVRTRLVGRVSMDMLAVDLSDVPQAGIGSKVELWGKRLPIDEVAEAAGTIGYELMCALAPRVKIVEDDGED